jgi:hypothetical protein|tara:strand:- start:92 stop:370 length:279 start_codon:yes stop_codon:yes gene_type:complete
VGSKATGKIMDNPKKKPKLTDLQLKDVRIEQLEHEIQTLRKAYISKQADLITQSEAMMKLYQWKVERLEKDRLAALCDAIIKDHEEQKELDE